MAKRKARKMSDLNKTRSTKSYYKKYMELNEGLSREKKAFGPQVLHFVKLAAKEGKKPSKVVMNPTSGKEKDNVKESMNGLLVTFKGSKYWYKF